MSDREKKLLIFFGLAVFVIVNLFGISWLLQKRQDLDRKLEEAKTKREQAYIYSENIEGVEKEKDWLHKHYPPVKARQIVQTELEQYASNQARMSKLELKPVKILAADESSSRFHRAKVQFVVEGMEQDFYTWLDRLQDPERMRGVTFMRISPKRDDVTKIESTVVVEQWYVPSDGSDDGGAAPSPVETTPDAPDTGTGEEAAPGLPPGIPVPTPAPTPTPEPSTPPTPPLPPVPGEDSNSTLPSR